MSATHCARATLAVQAHGTPLSHKKYRRERPLLTWKCLQLVARERRLRFRRMERHSCIKSRVDGNAHFLFYARVALHAPEPQAPLARNELQTLADQKSAFPSTLLFMHEWRSMRLKRKRRSRATSCRLYCMPKLRLLLLSTTVYTSSKYLERIDVR